MRLPENKYRIVGSKSLDYHVQLWRWYWPVWSTVRDRESLASAETAALKHAQEAASLSQRRKAHKRFIKHLGNPIVTAAVKGHEPMQKPVGSWPGQV